MTLKKLWRFWPSFLYNSAMLIPMVNFIFRSMVQFFCKMPSKFTLFYRSFLIKKNLNASYPNCIDWIIRTRPVAICAIQFWSWKLHTRRVMTGFFTFFYYFREFSYLMVLHLENTYIEECRQWNSYTSM